MIFNVNENEVKKASGKQVHIASALESPALIDIYGETTQDGTPTPYAPVSIESSVISEIEVCKKNILKNTATTQTISGVTFTVNSDGSITANGTASNNIYAPTINMITLQAGEKYILSGGVSENKRLILYYYEDLSKCHITSKGREMVFVAPITGEYRVYMYTVSGEVYNNEILYPMVRLATDTDDTYEPYSETVYTLPEPITLNGLNGVSDYISLKRGKLVQKFIKRNNLTFTLVSGYTIGNSELFGCGAGDGANKGTIVSNVLPFKQHEILANDTNGAYQLYGVLYARIQGISDVDEFNSLIANNEFVYELAEPVETQLSEANLKVLREFITQAGVNNISNNANAPMSVTYASTVGASMTLENTVALNGLKLVPISEAEFEALTEKDSNTLYLVYE